MESRGEEEGKRQRVTEGKRGKRERRVDERGREERGEGKCDKGEKEDRGGETAREGWGGEGKD